MNEQLKIINDLRTLGASNNTVAHEERRLQELQALCYKYFRRDMIKVHYITNQFLGRFKNSFFILLEMETPIDAPPNAEIIKSLSVLCCRIARH